MKHSRGGNYTSFKTKESHERGDVSTTNYLDRETFFLLFQGFLGINNGDPRKDGTGKFLVTPTTAGVADDNFDVWVRHVLRP